MEALYVVDHGLGHSWKKPRTTATHGLPGLGVVRQGEAEIGLAPCELYTPTQIAITQNRDPNISWVKTPYPHARFANPKLEAKNLLCSRCKLSRVA